MRLGVFALVLIGTPLAVIPTSADDLPQSILQVAHTLEHNRDLLSRVPMYTCLETISREQKGAKQHKPRVLDVVQVDVGVADSGEIYSWPGDETFSTSGLMGLVGQGYLATGLFDTFARNLFVSDVGIVRLAGEQTLQNTNTLHFTYTVPSLSTRWDVDWLGAQGRVGQLGEFWVDSKSLNLLRLVVDATDIPPALPLKTMHVSVDYQILAIDKQIALIPSSAETVAIELNGTLYRNDLAFSQCHVFGAESGLTATSQALTKAVQTYEKHRSALPPGLLLPMTLRMEVRGGRVKIGDALRATLDKAVRVSAELTIPAGALVTGRVREFQRIQEPPNTIQVGFAFDQLDWPGHIATFLADPVDLEKLAGLSTFLSRGTSRSFNSGAGMLTNSATENVWAAAIPGVCTFFLTGSDVVPKGFRITLRTRKTRER